MSVYLGTKFQVFSTILTSFGYGGGGRVGNFTPLPQNKPLKSPPRLELTLNCIVCTAISACAHSCNANTFTYSLTGKDLLQLKIHNIWMKFL